MCKFVSLMIIFNWYSKLPIFIAPVILNRKVIMVDLSWIDWLIKACQVHVIEDIYNNTCTQITKSFGFDNYACWTREDTER